MTLSFLRRPGTSPRRRFYSFYRAITILANLILFCILAVHSLAGTITAPRAEQVLVTHVVDGDTIKILRGRQQVTVRLIGVDTPETGRPDTPVQVYGPEAAHFTRRSLLEKRVRLAFETTNRPGGSTDKYERILAYVFTDDEKNFNLELIRQGFAKVFTKYPFQYQAEFIRAERAARKAGRGLWNDEHRAEWSDPARRGRVIGNIRTEVYHVPGQLYYRSVDEKNRIYFRTEQEAQDAGFSKARN
jgi:micrococcal nuclease